MNQITSKEVHIDATGMRLGKLSTKVAVTLMGKDTADFAKHFAPDIRVVVDNASQLDIPDKKKNEIYQSYSGWPGGRKTETLEHLANRLGYGEVIKRTVRGMLPKNKLQKVMLKNLIVNE